MQNGLFRMEQLMRWYGPSDPVQLSHIAQAGCSGVVTALHAVPIGDVWSVPDIAQHVRIIEEAGLTWTIVESLPVHEQIKTQHGEYQVYIENYKRSLRNLSESGIRVVTYNFMPVLDWVRTDVAYVLPNGAEALYFNKKDFAVFDLFMLKRPGARGEYSDEEFIELKAHFEWMDEKQKKYLFRNILLGLPGSDVSFTPEQVLRQLSKYKNIDRARLKQHLMYFLQEVVPVAIDCGIQLAIHPDDPPYTVLGLPRIMSVDQDIEDIVSAVPDKANGLCFCTGSFGARADNDLVAMIRKWGTRIHFLHLRNTIRDHDGNFIEANHLDGDTDMYSVLHEIVGLMQEEKRSLPMRPDHGHKMLDDLGKKTFPGYSAIGRLKGLAELRGLEYALINAYPQN